MNGGLDWLHEVRLLSALIITAAMGVHAFYLHKQEAAKAVSPRRWIYWMYSAVFFAAGVTNFAQFCITINFGGMSHAPYQPGFFSLLLVLSYIALLTGARRSISNK
ncbi:MAG: hypothetical protein ABFD54_15435 [Armatimonadota bacterium]|nr:hypothetical protein [bacterium]